MKLTDSDVVNDYFHNDIRYASDYGIQERYVLATLNNGITKFDIEHMDNFDELLKRAVDILCSNKIPHSRGNLIRPHGALIDINGKRQLVFQTDGYVFCNLKQIYYCDDEHEYYSKDERGRKIYYHGYYITIHDIGLNSSSYRISKGEYDPMYRQVILSGSGEFDSTFVSYYRFDTVDELLKAKKIVKKNINLFTQVYSKHEVQIF